jgi:hypothetical protein
MTDAERWDYFTEVMKQLAHHTPRNRLVCMTLRWSGMDSNFQFRAR